MLDLARARPSRSLVPALLIAILALQAQEPRKEFTDPVALLKAVAKTYAAGVDTFRMESIAEITSCAAPIYLRRFRSGVSRTGVSGECWSEPDTPDGVRNGTGANEARSFKVKSGRLQEV